MAMERARHRTLRRNAELSTSARQRLGTGGSFGGYVNGTYDKRYSAEVTLSAAPNRIHSAMISTLCSNARSQRVEW
jgi:hypothetical protein